MPSLYSIVQGLAVAAAAFKTVTAANAATWRDRSVYQLLTDRFARTDGSTTHPCAPGFNGFCGGTYVGIINHLDYIQSMGFDAIWISPITQQVADESRAWNGYTQTNLYGLNDYFGSAADLRRLAQELHNRKMYLMVDVVTNHYGAPGPAYNKSTFDFSHLLPLNSAQYFHEVCWITNDDYAANNENVRICWLGIQDYPLPDINTTIPHVRDVFNQWVKDIISNYSIDGLRIDTVKHVEADFWTGFQRAAGVYAVGEYADSRTNLVCPFQSTSSRPVLDGLFNYPVYGAATSFFATNSSRSAFLNVIEDVRSQCGDVTLLGSFTENHDQARFASLNNDINLAKNVLTFTLLTDGIPFVYAGQEQHYNGNSEQNREATWLSGYNEDAPLVHIIASLNQIRRIAILQAAAGAYSTSRANYFYYDDHSIGFSKGPAGTRIITAISNVGSSVSQTRLDLGTAHGYAQGTELVEVFTCTTVTTGTNGDLVITLKNGAPQVLYPSSKLGGTGVCGG